MALRSSFPATGLILALLLLCFLNTCSAATSRTCYYPNGEVSPDFPCDPDAEESACCGGGQGSFCLSNKVCSGDDEHTIRGSCTDKSWESTRCGLYCTGADTGGTDLISCKNVTGKASSYCCDHDEGCCDSGIGRFEALPSDPDAWARWNLDDDKYLVVGTVYTGEVTTQTVSDSSTTTSATSTTTTTTEAVKTTDVATTSSEPTAEPSRTPADASSSESDGLSTGAQAGIGAGVGVGVLLLGAIAFLLWKLLKNKKAANASAQPQWPSYQSPPAMADYYAPPKHQQEPQELYAEQYQRPYERVELPSNH